MSHHFDTDQAKNDPRLNCCDAYVFGGRSGHTVLVMTSNADAGISSPDAFHPEGLYALRVDTNGDAKEDVVFKFRFGEPRHAHGDETAMSSRSRSSARMQDRSPAPTAKSS